MGKGSKIEWTHHTFNPVHGCAKVSPGCDNCYAERDAKRFGTPWGVDAPRRTFGDKHWADPIAWDKAAAAKGERHRVFCASMADVFDKNWPDGTRERLWDLIRATPNLDWLLLTKRIGNARGMLPIAWVQSGSGMPANVWLGISVVNQEEADRDIPKLLAVPARVRFLSCEPLLGPIKLDMRKCCGCPIEGNPGDGYFQPPDPPRCCEDYEIGIDWVIVGGESGPSARPMKTSWARSIRDQCVEAGVAYHFKQYGEWKGANDVDSFKRDYGTMSKHPYSERFGSWEGDRFEIGYGGGDDGMLRVGKKAAGRELDGRTWDEFPRSAS